jgi:pyruvate/2-oxoglutarate dehydrogenase complex dihydrolipoamide acyltransferase (E2) component
MWQKLDISGKQRAKYIGTFGFTNYGMLGAESLHPLGPTTTVMTLSPISPDGDVTVKLVYDHRVLDGSYVARSLAHLQEVLHQTILPELQGNSSDVASSHAA